MIEHQFHFHLDFHFYLDFQFHQQFNFHLYLDFQLHFHFEFHLHQQPNSIHYLFWLSVQLIITITITALINYFWSCHLHHHRLFLHYHFVLMYHFLFKQFIHQYFYSVHQFLSRCLLIFKSGCLLHLFYFIYHQYSDFFHLYYPIMFHFC